MSLKDKLKIKINFKKQNKREKDSFSKWRLASILLLTVLILSFFYTIYFVYNNIYITLNNAQTIFILESQVGVDNLNTENFKKIKEQINKKEVVKNLEIKNIPVIFDYKTTTTTSSTLDINKNEN